MKIALETYLPDYLSSGHFSLVPPGIKPESEEILQAFCDFIARESREVAADSLKTFLYAGISRFNFPASKKQLVPDLLESFFNYLSDSGNCAQASNWSIDCTLLAHEFKSKIRPDGSVKGETFKKKYTDVGRNDPCPCGSGQKFKKCCMKLLEG